MFDPILQREVTSDEYFTPIELITKHIQGLDIQDKFIDNCCGIGNWLVCLLEEKIKAGIDHSTALQQLYGVELQEDSAQICRDRLLMGNESLRSIVEQNIVCADALRYHYRFDGSDPYETEEDRHFSDLFQFS